MPRGNKNPSPDTRFGGARGNPVGKTSKQRQMEIKNAQMATEIRNRLLKSLHGVILAPNAKAVEKRLIEELMRLKTMSPELLRLLKDTEDRGLGAPKASVDISNPDGSLQQRPTQEAVIGALLNIHAPSPSKRR